MPHNPHSLYFCIAIDTLVKGLVRSLVEINRDQHEFPWVVFMYSFGNSIYVVKIPCFLFPSVSPFLLTFWTINPLCACTASVCLCVCLLPLFYYYVQKGDQEAILMASVLRRHGFKKGSFPETTVFKIYGGKC